MSEKIIFYSHLVKLFKDDCVVFVVRFLESIFSEHGFEEWGISEVGFMNIEHEVLFFVVFRRVV